MSDFGQQERSSEKGFFVSVDNPGTLYDTLLDHLPKLTPENHKFILQGNLSSSSFDDNPLFKTEYTDISIGAPIEDVESLPTYALNSTLLFTDQSIFFDSAKKTKIEEILNNKGLKISDGGTNGIQVTGPHGTIVDINLGLHSLEDGMNNLRALLSRWPENHPQKHMSEEDMRKKILNSHKVSIELIDSEGILNVVEFADKMQFVLEVNEYAKIYQETVRALYEAAGLQVINDHIILNTPKALD